MHIRINKKRIIVYLLILTASVVFASFYGGLLPYVFLYGTLLLVPVSCIYILLNYRFLSVYQALDSTRVIKGESHELTVSFDNAGPLPVHDMELLLHSDRCIFDGITEGERIVIRPFCKVKILAGMECRYGGTYDAGLKALGFSDPFGILTVIINVPYTFRAIVSPGITDIANGYMDIENIMNASAAKSDIRYEEIPGNDMRDYHTGDPLKSINWKVSARLDKFVVRLPDKLDTRRITLILEAADVPERSRDTDFLRRRDYFLEFAVSAAWFFTSRGLPVTIIYPSAKITEMTIGSYDGFRDFYADIAGGLSYRSEDEKDRMHKLVQERRGTGYGNETAVIIVEDEWPGEGFCTVAG
ncbi:MAG: DUF58 domain-containing protein [Lachnospiraceae bacterium]|nr:DUF58 domain-containing protein [Lachnospiraceae bacterium]